LKLLAPARFLFLKAKLAFLPCFLFIKAKLAFFFSKSFSLTASLPDG
jgi:hypothetical protein